MCQFCASGRLYRPKLCPLNLVAVPVEASRDFSSTWRGPPQSSWTDSVSFNPWVTLFTSYRSASWWVRVGGVTCPGSCSRQTPSPCMLSFVPRDPCVGSQELWAQTTEKARIKPEMLPMKCVEIKISILHSFFVISDITRWGERGRIGEDFAYMCDFRNTMKVLCLKISPSSLGV